MKIPVDSVYFVKNPLFYDVTYIYDKAFLRLRIIWVVFVYWVAFSVWADCWSILFFGWSGLLIFERFRSIRPNLVKNCLSEKILVFIGPFFTLFFKEYSLASGAAKCPTERHLRTVWFWKSVSFAKLCQENDYGKITKIEIRKTLVIVSKKPFSYDVTYI